MRGLWHFHEPEDAGIELPRESFLPGGHGHLNVVESVNSDISRVGNQRLAKRGGVWFEGGSLRVHLGVEADFRAAKKAHPAFLVRQLDTLIQHLQRAGVAVVADEPLEGYNRIYVSDPFGNRIELLEPVTA